MLNLIKFQVIILIAYCEARVFSVQAGSRQARLSVAEPMPYYYHRNINGDPGTYSYGYDVTDPMTGNTQYRTEEQYPNGTVTGSYGYVDPDGRPHRYRYIADQWGYRVMKDPIPAYQPKPRPIPLTRPVDPVQESSITWTRPRKPSKKKIAKPVHNNWNKFVLPPSYYASLY